MARSNPVIILKAVAAWKSRILEAQGSLLGGPSCWAVESIRDLRKRFEGNLLEGKGRSFFDKLKEQLAGAPETTIVLAAETLWLLYLFPTNVGASKKRQNVTAVWNWSGKSLVPTQELLSDETFAGIGSGGPGFNNHIWREFLFAVVFFDEMMNFEEKQRSTMMGDAIAFTTWLDSLPASIRRQFRHMLLFMLFPDRFERISSGHHKREILLKFGQKVDSKVMDERLAIDLALVNLRDRLAKERGTFDFDFYDVDLRKIWKSDTDPGTSPVVIGVQGPGVETEMGEDIAGGVRYWVVGANWDGVDKTAEFIDQGVWLNGYEDKYIDRVRSVSMGDRIAIKAAFRQKNGLPFENKGHDVGVMRIKARGTVTENPGDGRRLVVEWEDDFEQLDIFGYVWQPTISEVNSKKMPQVITWVFYGVKQPMDRLAAEWWPSVTEKGPAAGPMSSGTVSYDHEPINRIYYGPPGTGKTYILQSPQGLDRIDEYKRVDRIDGEPGLEVVTFHQSFAYEDFIEGLRPVSKTGGVSYEVRNGLFKRLCLRAIDNPDKKFALFIDEINRGNLSAIFGELITLIESDKRLRFTDTGEADFSRPGTYIRLPLSDERFGVPCNIDIYATMNTADRSLVRIDTALRRRFEFVECMPLPQLLRGRSVAGIDLERLLATMNGRIEKLLDREHTIGHAYFLGLPSSENLEPLARLFERKILPLLEEYFFEDWGRIATVLNDKAKGSDEKRFIVLSKTPGDEEENPKRHFRKNPTAFMNPESYVGVYA